MSLIRDRVWGLIEKGVGLNGEMGCHLLERVWSLINRERGGA